MPKYSAIDEAKYDLHYENAIGEMPIRVSGIPWPVHVQRSMLPGSPVEIYFIDCPHFFHRKTIYTDDADEGERFILFSKAVIETLQRLQWAPDVIHCNDWQSALMRERLLAMPVERADLDTAARDYQRQLESLAGPRPVLDLVQLGLGTDGHTASLVPGDPVLAVDDCDVALSGEYQGLRRMTLTYPALDRARRRLWLVTGAAKAMRLQQLLTGPADRATPALRVNREDAAVVADAAALSRPAGTLSRPHGRGTD